MSIRGGAVKSVAIVESSTGRLLGEVDAGAASDVHTGAVYLHQGETYVVDNLDLEANVAWVRADFPEYSTQVVRETDIRVVRTRRTQRLADGVWLADVDVEVSHTVTGYRKRLPGGEILEVVPLDVPPERLFTRAVAYTVDPEVLKGEMGLPEPTWPGALHAAEHAAIGMLPLIATCDRWDIGGVSTVLHQDTPAHGFVYDGYAGGAGFAERGFEAFSQWMQVTKETVEACECASGCPSCVQSPKCGNGNEPLFKAGLWRF